ncbi:hypothetical protein [Motiliproteus sediminis]|uniref:hypothetical protein n=1 Tax=Motiliproteus sediminis TaxID=1468178 RepID=UPI001AEFB289|nr:hypothetical protein [Motiliproteus sediminis]
MLYRALLAALLSATSPLSHAASTQLSGYVEFELRHFFNDPLDPVQASTHPSAAVEPELYSRWNDGDDSITLTPFARVDHRDSERTHVDLREANWLHVGDGWQLRSGVGKVFWGATESQHLVDVINQTDNLEGVDGEDKLGQPMVNLVWLTGNGELSLFWLPYFREREFAGLDGRPRSQPRVDADQAAYESGQQENHQDFALRWTASFDLVDVALSHFHGTSREPQFRPGTDSSGNPVLTPFYPLIDQTGLEFTAALGNWLWKLEAIRREGFGDTYHAAVGGFEYTLVGLFSSDVDLGLLLEYHVDERDQQASSPFQNDTFAGVRLTFNDFQSSEFLAGIIYDNDSYAHLGFVEASRRLGDAFKLSLEVRLFEQLPPNDPLYSQRQDDFVQLNLAYYF